ncbi:MAG: DUF1194 domain-containing protein [Alphaproteobacteria bacterium]|nr:DUF1194 domain-containing protein [Alphaproteobacteria bacterium]
MPRPLRLAGLALLAVLLLTLPPRTVPGQAVVELHLVMAFDVSASVNDVEYDLQRTGTALAFNDTDIRAAIGGAPGGIAVTVIQWASDNHQAVALPWVTLREDADIDALVSALIVLPRQLPGGNTMIHGGLAFAGEQFAGAPGTARRRVIDIAGNGHADNLRKTHTVRDRLVDAGITINGLAIEEHGDDLTSYFHANVIGGPGAFVETARDFPDFGDAMRRKLLREIGPPRFAGQRPDGKGVARSVLSKRTIGP